MGLTGMHQWQRRLYDDAFDDDAWQAELLIMLDGKNNIYHKININKL